MYMNMYVDSVLCTCMFPTFIRVLNYRKRFRGKHGHYKDHSYITSGEFSLDPIKDYDEDGEAMNYLYS